jgi:hypothetical protein
VIRGCNIFWGQKLANTCSFVGGRIIVQQKKNLESRTQLEEPTECASGGDPIRLYKTLHLLFFPLVRILCALRLESPINWMFLIRDLWNFSFFGRGNVLPTHSELCRFFRVTGKTLGLISLKNFSKKFLSASAVAIISWQDVTRSSPCSGVKECGTKWAHNFLFPKSFSESEELQSWGCSKILPSFLMRLDGHF